MCNDDNSKIFNQLVLEYLTICDNNCCGDTSTGIDACPFYRFPDVTDNENTIIKRKCVLKDYE